MWQNISSYYSSQSLLALGSPLSLTLDTSLKRRHHRNPEGRGQNHQRWNTHFMIFRFLQNKNISENLRMDWVRQPSRCLTQCSAPRTTPWWWPTGAPPPPCAARWSRTRSTEWWVVRRLEYILGHGSHSHILSGDAMSDRTLVGKRKYIIQYIISARIPGKDIVLSHQCLLPQQIILRPEPL